LKLLQQLFSDKLHFVESLDRILASWNCYQWEPFSGTVYPPLHYESIRLWSYRDAAKGLVLEECQLLGELGGLEVVEDERDSTCSGRRAVPTEDGAAGTAATAAPAATATASRRVPHRQVPHPVVRRPADITLR